MILEKKITIESDATEPFVQVSCTLSPVGSNPYQSWDKTRLSSHELFLIKIDVDEKRIKSNNFFL